MNEAVVTTEFIQHVALLRHALEFKQNELAAVSPHVSTSQRSYALPSNLKFSQTVSLESATFDIRQSPYIEGGTGTASGSSTAPVESIFCKPQNDEVTLDLALVDSGFSPLANRHGVRVKTTVSPTNSNLEIALNEIRESVRQLELKLQHIGEKASCFEIGTTSHSVSWELDKSASGIEVGVSNETHETQSPFYSVALARFLSPVREEPSKGNGIRCEIDSQALGTSTNFTNGVQHSDSSIASTSRRVNDARELQGLVFEHTPIIHQGSSKWVPANWFDSEKMILEIAYK